MLRHGLIHGLLLCSFALLAQALLEPADPKSYPRSAEIGEVGFVVYEVVQRGDPPDHICSPNDYNCTTPHGMCSDDHDKYQLVIVAPPVTHFDGHMWFCGIKIEDVSLNDVGVYKICKLTEGAQTIHGCVEHQNLHIYFAAWERDSHGRICQTTYDETSNKLINNCSSLTTTPQATTTTATPQATTTTATPQATTTITTTTTEEKETAPLTTNAVEPYPILLTTYTEKEGSNDAYINEKLEPRGECYSRQDIILTAVGVCIAMLALFAVIWGIRTGVRKRRKRSQFHDHEGYMQALPMGPSPVAGNGFAVHGDSDDDSTGDSRA